MSNRSQHRATADTLFLEAERLASETSLFPDPAPRSRPSTIEGLVSSADIRRRLSNLRKLSVDEYVRQTVAPVEDPSRPSVRTTLKRLGWRVERELESGPLYAAEAILETRDQTRRIGLLVQDRSQRNGAWMPEHHEAAVRVVRDLAVRAIPIVTFIDTPGADAGSEANRGNQAHSISRLIAEMAQIHVPTVGVIFGNGYSGGAIPLATTNVLLSTTDGVFNTIQPRGLANIARKYNLSWQECAKAVGVSPYELWEQGYLDGIIDYSPNDGSEGLENLERAILTAIDAVEQQAATFLRGEPGIFDHYRRTIQRFLEPSERLRKQQSGGRLSTLDTPTQQPNIFGVTYRYLRYLGLRKRVRSTTVERYGRLSVTEIPTGDLNERIERENRAAFGRWLENPLAIKYDDALQAAWKNYTTAREALAKDRSRFTAFFLGSRESNYRKALNGLVLELAFHLYNVWKSGAKDNFPLLVEHLEEMPASSQTLRDPTVLELLAHPEIRQPFVRESRNLILFDGLYDQLILELRSVAFEAMQTNRMSQESVEALLEQAMSKAAPIAARSPVWNGEEPEPQDLIVQMRRWIPHLVRNRRRAQLLKSVADWKKAAFPTVSEPLFALITFFFDHLLPSYYSAQRGGRYDGRIRPRNIGIKDFWSRLDRAYKDLLIQAVLNDVKRRSALTPQVILDTFFSDVEELDRTMMTEDPVRFPGFRISIEQELDRGGVPCGTVSALASFESDGEKRRVGVLVSNLGFQAGSFDMASGEKFCKLLVRCAAQGLPVVCFISSGGMQTKEGAGSLFSMAIVNDRITRFVRDNDLPILMFGFGDCTGGAQASMVTHPLVQTYYFSGTSMPFAGQIVVPSHLPCTSTLSNYLSQSEGAMAGLVAHPFADDLDQRLSEIDEDIPLPTLEVRSVIAGVLAGRAPASESVTPRPRRRARKIFRPTRRTLIHARGCTAVKLVRDAQKRDDVEIVLVQSDPDMESVAAANLRSRDTLVCLGGSTPDESYLNAHSVIRIAEAESCDSLHPGIGFLSENASFADLCNQHDLNFIGPPVRAMEWMGNKSNAVQTARKLGVAVVPGSHGVVTTPEAALRIASDIGYPVMIKAVHGGGGRGIHRVDDERSMADDFLRMAAEAQSAFGSRDLYIEKYIGRFRHVEIQVLRDREGNTRVLGLRDCSVQRNHQKLVEESGSTLLSQALREEAFRSAAAIADEIGYVGAGTVEFIFDLEAQALYFMEMNTRLQVEHPVTEAVTGIGIVAAQFEIASGGSIAEMKPSENGFAIEVRVNAERMERAVGKGRATGGLRIVPAPGSVTACEFPTADDVDVIACVKEGSVVSPYYDNLVAQVVVHAKDRISAIDRLDEVLGQVRIEGISTNIALIRRVLQDDEFRSGDHDTGYLPRLFQRIDLDALVAEVEEASGRKKGGLDRSQIEIEGGHGELKVVAPQQGIYYSAPAPGKPDFIQVGDRVRSGEVLCLLEAMKLFEEISLGTFNREGELYPEGVDYEVVRINPSNGQLVSEGDLLFVVRPAA
ncbi:MAG: ATP-grasp domain-containing protein [Acidobacteria bacterium]|nr:MAG: ATP-grasp domain-containing protein [Acidobacteriota bacterium]REK00887.1 MAG: ATP-grasp domain-containing protein [Acidobacteriota bacterium]